MCQKTAVTWLSSPPETVPPLPVTNTRRSPGLHITRGLSGREDGNQSCLTPVPHRGPGCPRGAQEGLFLPTSDPASGSPCQDLALEALGGRDMSARESGRGERAHVASDRPGPLLQGMAPAPRHSLPAPPAGRLSCCRGQTEGQPPGPPDTPLPVTLGHKHVPCSGPPSGLCPTSWPPLLWPCPGSASASNLLDPNWTPERVHLLTSV